MEIPKPRSEGVRSCHFVGFGVNCISALGFGITGFDLSLEDFRFQSLGVSSYQGSRIQWSMKKIDGVCPFSYDTSMYTEVVEKYSKPLLTAQAYSQLEKTFSHLLA